MTTPRRLLATAAVGLCALSLGACSDDSTSDSSATTTTAAAAGSTTSAAGSSQSSTTAKAGGTKVNANTASIDELAAAFDAAGVPNASRWAREVDEYRPYTDDNWAHLRSELSKYNIDAATFDKIIGALEL